VVDEGALTCMMPFSCWKAIDQPKLSLLPTFLMTFDGRSFRPHIIISSFPVQLEGKIVCDKVELFDVPLDCNLLLGRSWNYVMHVVVATVFRFFCFPHDGQLSYSHPDPSSGASMVSMIDNPQPGTINLGVGLFPSFMGTFYYLLPSSDVRLILVVLDQLRYVILQLPSF
jgi:hypothetical protein